ncbi:NLR family CARD domain-containing protein 4-like [Porites lutea]|uniref:NLR family CARD domain-containing protein 4-like n=1 Tax=Porites lutea TaxID=51062 RepID=UPI003CC62AE2
MKSFDLNSCRSKLEDHYQKTATVPTSVWSKKSIVDIHQIYTRLSWVKDEQTPAGTTQSELKHYCDLFNANKNGAIPKRILVQGQTGIGKSTFVKKLLVDWVEVNKKTGDEQAAVLKNFELVVAVNLKEVSKRQSLKDVISFSNVFAKEDKYMTEGLVDYITNNQEKVLLIFDGYDEYRCGCNSEIYEIFNGKSLRNCRVLITTRISKADELRGGEDLQAEIRGFSEVDRNDFMRRFLSDDEVSNLRKHLYERKLNELAKVPLLLLFLCTLWKKGQSKHFPKTKTTLYMDIIEFVLNHSHSKQSSPRYVEVASFKDLLSEMGKVALQGLLKDDHLFEYSQLSDSVRCDESVFIGLLQITEYSETLRPVGLVSFIHKSIQEFLAAWYVTHRCIPEGRNLGEIGVKLEECLALENVFQFICGLSKDGASTVFRHLKSVRISDPSLDLSKAIPDVENETDEPWSDVTERQEKFRDLVLFLFAELTSEAEFSSSCLDLLGSILPVSDSFPNYLLEKAIDTNSWYLVFNGRSRSQSSSASRLGFDYDIFNSDDSNAHGSSCEQSVDDSLCDLVEQVPNPGRCSLSIEFCALTSTGAVKLASLLPRLENVTFLSLGLFKCSTDAAARLVAAIKHKTLKKLLLEIVEINLTSALVEALCQSLSELSALKELEIGTSDGYCLEADDLVDVDDRRSFPSLKIRGLTDSSAEATTRLIDVFDHNIFRGLKLTKIRLTPAVAEVLVQLLPKLSALQALKIKSLTECSDEAVTRLIDGINHKTLERLELSEMNLTSVVAESLGRSLPELSALEQLVLSGSGGCNLQQKEMEAMFGRFSRPSSLRKLSITCFSARGSLASLAKNLCFFPCLETLQLKDLDMDEADLCSFLENLKYIPDLQYLYLMDNPLGQPVRLMVPYLLQQKKLEMVRFRRGDVSEEDLNYVQKAVQEKRPQLSIEEFRPCIFI